MVKASKQTRKKGRKDDEGRKEGRKDQRKMQEGRKERRGRWSKILFGVRCGSLVVILVGVGGLAYLSLYIMSKQKKSKKKRKERN